MNCANTGDIEGLLPCADSHPRDLIAEPIKSEIHRVRTSCGIEGIAANRRFRNKRRDGGSFPCGTDGYFAGRSSIVGTDALEKPMITISSGNAWFVDTR